MDGAGPGPTANGGATASPDEGVPAAPEPPEESYARLDAPDAVVVAVGFEVVVGLAPEPQPGVVGPALLRPPGSHGDYDLDIQMVAQGFTLERGRWRRRLRVTGVHPYPTTTFHLIAKPQRTDLWPATIQAIFSTEGQTMGMALRAVVVVARAELLGATPVAPAQPTGTIRPPTDEHPADLTVHILKGHRAGELLWTFESPHPLDCPDAPVETDVGRKPEIFTAKMVEELAQHRGGPGLLPFLAGVGETMADQVPDELFTLLEGAAAVCGRAPTVLLLSSEPYLPWELTSLPTLLDPSKPPFLACQAVVGRWVLGHRKPALPPPDSITLRHVAVVSGIYDRDDWRLAQAEAEAADMVRDFGATSIDARPRAVFACLAGDPPAEVLHFALHGTYEPEGVVEGLVLVDGSLLDPLQVKGTPLSQAPLVFLNSCQVGNGNRVLGDYAGLAEAFLHAGASAVVAPLWAIDDAAARELSQRFYRRVLAGDAPAVVLHDERSTFAAPDADGAATRLAYQFFGHPSLTLAREP